MFHFLPDDFPDNLIRIDTGSGVKHAAFFPDSGSILVLSADGSLYIHDAATGAVRRRLIASDPVRALISPDGSLVLTICADNRTQCWETSEGDCVSRFEGHRDLITDAAFVSNRRIVTVANDGSACVWDAQSGSVKFELSGHEGHRINSVAVSPDERMIVTTSDEQRSVVVWDAVSGDAIAYNAWVGESRPTRAVFQPGGDRLALLVRHGPTEILGFGEQAVGDLLPQILSHHQLEALKDKDPVPYLVEERTLGDDFGRLGSFSADGRRLLVINQGPRSNPIVWRVKDGAQVAELDYEDQITSIAQFSRDGRCVLTATGTHPQVIADGEKFDSQVAGIWDADTGENLFLLHGHTDRITNARFSPDERRVLTASLDGSVLIWPIEIENLALCAAAYENKTDAISKWIANGADTSFEVAAMSACHFAASQGHDDAVALLLEGTPSPDVVTSKGATPLLFAADGGHTTLVNWLLAAGADPDRPGDISGKGPLHAAAENGHREVCEALLDAGASLDRTTPQNWTPLYLTELNNHAEIALMLIGRDANVDIHADDGTTALYGAAFQGMDTVVDALLTHGADPNCQHELGYSPLIVAAEKGYTGIVRALLAAVASHALRTKRNFTALHSAATGGHHDAIEALISSGAALDEVTDVGDTPLNLAAANGDPKSAALLLAAGASRAIANEARFAPLHTSAWHAHVEVVTLLLDAGADIDAHGPEGLTALHIAARGSYLDIVRQLLDRGADRHANSDTGHPPFKYAGNPAVRELLHVTSAPAKAAPDDLIPKKVQLPARQPPPLANLIEALVKRSIRTYHEQGRYAAILGERLMDYARSKGIDEIADEILDDAGHLGTLKLAFAQHPPTEDELYVDTIDDYAVLTTRRYFLIEGQGLLRAPLELAEITSYGQSGIFKKHEKIQLSSGESIERKTRTAIDPDVMQHVIDYAGAAAARLSRVLQGQDIRARHQAVREMDEHEHRRILTICPDLSVKILAAQLLTEAMARRAMIFTLAEEQPIFEQIADEYRGRPIKFDKAAFIAMFDEVGPFEIEFAMQMYPERELAETIVEQTINLGGPTGRIVRAAFHDDDAAEAAFASKLLPHDADIYAETFCDTFEDRLHLANLVAKEWVPHPEYDWKTREDAVRNAFARYSLAGRSIEDYVAKGNEQLVDAYLRAEAEKLRSIGLE